MLRKAQTFGSIGPKAAEYLQNLTSFDLSKLTFGTSAYIPIGGFNLHVARGGYTGEDGFEACISHQTLLLSANVLARSLSLLHRPWK